MKQRRCLNEFRFKLIEYKYSAANPISKGSLYQKWWLLKVVELTTYKAELAKYNKGFYFLDLTRLTFLPYICLLRKLYVPEFMEMMTGE